MPPVKDDPVALLTGASSGLGLAVGRVLRWKSYRLALTARQPSLSRFQQEGFVDNDRMSILPLDVTDVTDRETALNQVAERWGGVDVLLNNAGISCRTVVEYFSEADFQYVMDVNLFGPMMRTRRAGRILSVSSVGGMMAMHTMALYSASKFVLEGACEALWYAVRPRTSTLH